MTLKYPNDNKTMPFSNSVLRNSFPWSIIIQLAFNFLNNSLSFLLNCVLSFLCYYRRGRGRKGRENKNFLILREFSINFIKWEEQRRKLNLCRIFLSSSSSFSYSFSLEEIKENFFLFLIHLRILFRVSVFSVLFARSIFIVSLNFNCKSII